MTEKITPTRYQIERKGETFRLVFPTPQRYTVNTYHRSARRTYSALEPVYTPALTIEISRDTAMTLVAQAHAAGTLDYSRYDANGRQWMAYLEA